MNHIVGLDLSLTGSGLACICGQLKVVGRDGVTKLPLSVRIEAVAGLVDAIIEWTFDHTEGESFGERWPRTIVIEAPAYSKTSGGAVERHAMWWLVCARLTGDGNPPAVATTNQVKQYATGKGNSQKGPMLDSLARRLPMFDTGGDDNLVDAAWLAAMGADRLGSPLVAMPAAHRKALDGVKWPVT